MIDKIQYKFQFGQIHKTKSSAVITAGLKAKCSWLKVPTTIRYKLFMFKMGSPEERNILKKMRYANSSYGNVQRGWYECSKGRMWFRSKLEADWALYLDFLVKQKSIKNWEYEAKHFDFSKWHAHGNNQYLPDFQIEENNGEITYQETKGYMDSASKTKLKRMARHYPEVKVVLITQKEFLETKKRLGKLVNWN